MQYPDPNMVNLSIPWIVVLFTILAVFWGIYIYLEFKLGNNVNKYVSVIFIVLAIIGIIGVIIQPKQFIIDFTSMYGEDIHIEMEISNTHYLFFACDVFSILLFIYIGLFIFPKRFKKITIIKIIGYLVFIGCFALIIYSYIKENENYKYLFEALKSLNIYAFKYYGVKSFIISQNAYGMMMMIGIIFCCIHHAISKHWWYWLIALFLYINMFFSFCRASLLLSPVVMLIYVFYCIFSSIKKKTSIVLLVVLSSLLISFASIVIVCYLSKGAILPKLYQFIILFDSKSTVQLREIIWSNTCILMNLSLPLSLFFGRGFGLMNEMLLQMNLSSGFVTQLVFPTHNSYLNLLAEGGFIYLFSYLLLVVYVSYIFLKSYKKNTPLAIALALGIVVFSFYSLIETIHYLVYPFMFLMFVFYNVYYQSKSETIN